MMMMMMMVMMMTTGRMMMLLLLYTYLSYPKHPMRLCILSVNAEPGTNPWWFMESCFKSHSDFKHSIILLYYSLDLWLSPGFGIVALCSGCFPICLPMTWPHASEALHALSIWMGALAKPQGKQVMPDDYSEVMSPNSIEGYGHGFESTWIHVVAFDLAISQQLDIARIAAK